MRAARLLASGIVIGILLSLFGQQALAVLAKSRSDLAISLQPNSCDAYSDFKSGWMADDVTVEYRDAKRFERLAETASGYGILLSQLKAIPAHEMERYNREMDLLAMVWEVQALGHRAGRSTSEAKDMRANYDVIIEYPFCPATFVGPAARS